MLEKDRIPDKEPQIRVGIILPEDNFFEVSIKLPSDAAYLVTSEHGEQLAHAEDLHFKIENGAVKLNSIMLGTKWTILPNQSHHIAPKTGMIVQKVIAGRGFHWQKHINVHLPGAVEVISHDDRLILINELPLEQYLMCVATSEMGARCPAALIEAQTIVARSWMLANVEQKHIALGMDVCNDDCCQRYQGSGNLTEHAIKGALHTYGQVLMYDQHICDARYSKSCGGIMESFSTIWDGPDLDYLQNIPDMPEQTADPPNPIKSETDVKSWIDAQPHSFCSPHIIPEDELSQYLGSVDQDGKYFRWQVQYTQKEICTLLGDRLGLDIKEISDITVLSRGGSGRIIALKISYHTSRNEVMEFVIERDVAIRRALHKGFLYSSCIYLDLERDEQNKVQQITIHGAGWGHGAGLCQIGALGMALEGYNTEAIVQHYYPGSQLKQIY